MKPVRRAGAVILPVALAFLINDGLAQPQDRGGESARIEPKELGRLLELIKPAGEHELKWREIPWMTDVAKARQKAADEGKMLIHWSLTHHPLGAS